MEHDIEKSSKHLEKKTTRRKRSREKQTVDQTMGTSGQWIAGQKKGRWRELARNEAECAAKKKKSGNKEDKPVTYR